MCVIDKMIFGIPKEPDRSKDQSGSFYFHMLCSNQPTVVNCRAAAITRSFFSATGSLHARVQCFPDSPYFLSPKQESFKRI